MCGNDYRVYLYDSDNKIRAAEGFVAADDLEALEIGAVLYRATQDVFYRHEVWCGARHLTGAMAARGLRTPTLDEMAKARQLRAVDVEERLASSFACVRRSRVLLQEVDRLLTARNRQVIRECDDRGQKVLIES